MNPALDGAGRHVFVAAARGSLILPPDGSWSVVKQQTDTGDVKPVEEGQSVPLIKPNGSTNFRIANPADVGDSHSLQDELRRLAIDRHPEAALRHSAVLAGQSKLKSDETYFADAYKLLNSQERLSQHRQRAATDQRRKGGCDSRRRPDARWPTGTSIFASSAADDYVSFINEPNILRVYAQYKNTTDTAGKLTLGIDSAAALADRWKAALSGMRIVVDLGPFKEIMWVDGNFNASSGLDPKYDKSPICSSGRCSSRSSKSCKILATLSGDDFDNGMDVGMSNSPDNWEYKFHCSKEIPVIQFPVARKS